MISIATLSLDVPTTIDLLLKLPPEQRLEIGERLLESVPVEFDDATIAEWQRRMQEVDDGVVTGVPAHEAIAASRKALHEAGDPAP